MNDAGCMSVFKCFADLPENLEHLQLGHYFSLELVDEGFLQITEIELLLNPELLIGFKPAETTRYIGVLKFHHDSGLLDKVISSFMINLVTCIGDKAAL